MAAPGCTSTSKGHAHGSRDHVVFRSWTHAPMLRASCRLPSCQPQWLGAQHCKSLARLDPTRSRCQRPPSHPGSPGDGSWDDGPCLSDPAGATRVCLHIAYHSWQCPWRQPQATCHNGPCTHHQRKPACTRFLAPGLQRSCQWMWCLDCRYLTWGTGPPAGVWCTAVYCSHTSPYAPDSHRPRSMGVQSDPEHRLPSALVPAGKHPNYPGPKSPNTCRQYPATSVVWRWSMEAHSRGAARLHAHAVTWGAPSAWWSLLASTATFASILWVCPCAHLVSRWCCQWHRCRMERHCHGPASRIWAFHGMPLWTGPTQPPPHWLGWSWHSR